MRPRPTSRKRPLAIVPVQTIVDEVAELRAEGLEPVAIITGKREWLAVRKQPGSRGHIEWWPGDDETFDRVPILTRLNAGAPRVMATQQDMEAVLLAKED